MLDGIPPVDPAKKLDCITEDECNMETGATSALELEVTSPAVLLCVGCAGR